MRWLILCVLILSFPVVAAAQDCPDGTPEGMSPDDAPCQLCRNGVLEYLPPRTTCSESEQFGCDANGAFRTECALVVPPNGDETECKEKVRKGPACPNGLTCDDGEMVCRLFCADDDECQDGYECIAESCELIPTTMDMGGAPDMGSNTDMGGAPDMGLPSSDMDPDDGSSTTMPTRPDDDDSGCCTVIAGEPDGAPVVLILVALLATRRRRE